MVAAKANGADGQGAGGTRRKLFRVFAGAIAVGCLGGAVYWLLTRNHETTDDAFVEADMVQISPQVGGLVAAVDFTDNQRVVKGQRLIAIDPRDYDVALVSARANLDQARAARQAAAADLDLTRATTGAAIDQAKNGVEQARRQVAGARQQAEASAADAVRAAADIRRYEELVAHADTSRQRYEQAVADAHSTAARRRASQLAATAAEAEQAQAEARLADAEAAPQRIAQKEAQLATATAAVEVAEANVRAAEINLSYTRLFAPQTGRIGRRAVNVGDVVQKNQTLASLVVDPPWVVANFKETQLDRMRPGQPVAIFIDAFPDLRLKGHVDSVQPGSGARFALLPAENATGNYVKVVQRIPVKILFDGLPEDMVSRLVPGMSVVPDVDVGARPEPPHVAGAAP
jgi:membrane fusion protein (multidrug efflux system)